jgi:hypothetical protein
MHTATSLTAWIGEMNQSDLGNSNPEDGPQTIADLAANTRDNSMARVVREYLKPTTALDPSSPSSALDVPVLRERRSSNVASYHALQEWEGYVTAIGAETFTADLVDKTRATDQPDEQVEMPLDEIGDEQFGELRVGAIFRWTIGYETAPSGQQRRVSQLVFRQLPRWTQAEIDHANQLGAARHRHIQWD